MRSWRRLVAKFVNYFQGKRAERELNREIGSHLALIEDDFQLSGMSPDEARRAAKRAYGSVELAKELHRDERSLIWLEQGWQDLRHASRTLRASPGFTLIAVITLALGIGVNTTLFTAYNALALKPLPVSNPKEVVRVKRWQESGTRGDSQYAFSYPEYVYSRDHNHSFSTLVAASWPVQVLGDSGTLSGQLVSANYFAGLGIGSRLGRTFLPEEDRVPGANPVVVLSYAFWQRRLNGESRILGDILKLNGLAFTIVGVAPQEFTGTSVLPDPPNFWAPLSMQAQLAPGMDWLNTPDDDRFQILGRLKPSTSVGQAQAEADGLVRQFAATFVARDKTVAVTLQPTRFLAEADDPRFQALVAALMLIVGMVLLVACTNIANMLLVRGAARKREIGVRLALGASRGRVIRHLLTESLLLSLVGGAAGVVLSLWTSKLLWNAIQEMLIGPGFNVYFSVDLTPDFRVLGYALLLSLGTGILFGLSPALQSTRSDLSTALKEEVASFGQKLSRSRLRSLLVGAQVAVSMVLLISAGFLARGLVRSQSAATGFETRRVLLLSAAFGDDSKGASRKRLLLMRLQALPELKNAAIGGFPASGTWTPPMLTSALRGRTLASFAESTYFDTLGIPIVRGRGFEKRETEKEPVTARAGTRFTMQGEVAQHVAVISESAARRFWPAEDPIGKRFQLDMDFRGSLAEFEVIGIALDVRYANLTRIDPAHVYLPSHGGGPTGILLRVQGDPGGAVAAVRKVVEQADKDLLPGLFLASIEEGPLRLQRSTARAYGMFAMILAFLAVTLAGVGIYGVMAYLVNQRVKEIGIRVALGATRGGVLKAVVLQGLRPVFAGIGLGITGAAGLSSVLHATLVFPGAADFFYGVPFYDPATFVAFPCLLAGISVIASVVPARRALGVDPMVALRHE